MFGYMTERQAVEAGLTHHGSYYGIPIWMGDLDSEGPMICAKWAPMEYLMSAVHYLEGMLAPIMRPDMEPCFMFKVEKEIEDHG